MADIQPSLADVVSTQLPPPEPPPPPEPTIFQRLGLPQPVKLTPEQVVQRDLERELERRQGIVQREPEPIETPPSTSPIAQRQQQLALAAQFIGIEEQERLPTLGEIRTGISEGISGIPFIGPVLSSEPETTITPETTIRQLQPITFEGLEN